MSRLAIVRDDKFQEHLTPQLHPESPQRLAAIDAALKASKLDETLDRLYPRPATEDELVTVHNDRYIEILLEQEAKAKKEDTLVLLDADTWMSPETYDVAKLAAGAGLVGVDSIAGSHDSAFVVSRPPGHHALAGRAMGFCLFNNLAVATRYAQKKLGTERVMVIDWDVHHGNGTQDMFYNDPSVCFLSMHQFPFWPPNSGWYKDDGAGEGKGYNINVPLPAGTGDRGYLKAWDEIVAPICREYKPQLIMVSAGYDAHQSDPLATQNVSTAGFALLTQRLCELTKGANAKVVCFLEGGYNTTSLANSVLATMNVLNSPHPDKASAGDVLITTKTDLLLPVTEDKSPLVVDERITEVRHHFAEYWTSLK
ncbi:MAG: histone deacetylase [Candidatus Obscuribacterales bacterium]|nr:histone deacetylase [Candidatus Obscuribacterales bacterium]